MAVPVPVRHKRQTSLRDFLLLFGHSSVGVHQHDGVALSAESERSLVTCDGLVREVLENLFQSGLRDAVLLNAKASLLVLESAEEPADGFVFLGHAQLEVLAALLEDLNLLEVARHVVQDTEAESLRLEEFEEVSEADFAVWVQVSLKR